MRDKSETREQRFKRLAEQRVNVVLDKLRILGQLSNKSNYDYTAPQVDAMFKAIQKDLDGTKAKFKEASRPRKRFSFR